LATEVNDAVRTGHVSTRLEQRWRGQLQLDPWWIFTPVPIHGDMAAEHLLQHSDRISAMTDFASVQVSDPAEDLAQILAPLPPDVAGSIVGAYRKRRADMEDPHLENRAAFLGEIAIIRWLQHGLALGDSAIIEDARNMLADLDRAVEEEDAAAEREAAAAALAAEKLQEAKDQAEAEAAERRDAATRASASAARERERATGSTPRVDAAIPPDPAQAAPGTRPAKPLTRKPVSESGVSVWGKKAPSWADAPTQDPEPEAASGADSASGGEPGTEAAPGADSASEGQRPTEAAPGVDSATGPANGRATGPAADPATDGDGAEAGSLATGIPAPAPLQEDLPDFLTETSEHEATLAPGADQPGKDGSLSDEPPRPQDPEEAATGEEQGSLPGDLGPDDRGDDQPGTAGAAGAARTDREDDEPDSGEMTQAFLPDFLSDPAEAPTDIAAAAGRDETEALDRAER
jgi:hypothetical protein